MIYKIQSFFNNTFFINGKDDLFNFLDYQLKHNNYRDIVTDDFNKSHKGGFFVRNVKEINAKHKQHYRADLWNGCFFMKVEYVNALFIITDEKGFVVNYEKLYNEYSQSRNIEYKPWVRKVYDCSTSKYRKSVKNARYSKNKNTYKKEYSLSLFDEEEGIKVRKKRQCDLKWNFIHLYDDDFLRTTDKSWKTNKIKKQWQKKQR